MLKGNKLKLYPNQKQQQICFVCLVINALFGIKC